MAASVRAAVEPANNASTQRKYFVMPSACGSCPRGAAARDVEETLRRRWDAGKASGPRGTPIRDLIADKNQKARRRLIRIVYTRRAEDELRRDLALYRHGHMTTNRPPTGSFAGHQRENRTASRPSPDWPASFRLPTAPGC